ncbi:MAG: hypothetical protein KDD58_10570 [Bdellovibrionales bacterium]|nr:hypothetical protein [Bdellovibrionales bacterium]
MAEDSIDQNQSEQVDIESMRVSILMIVKNKSQFGSVINFLQRRNWECKVVSQMNEAILSLSRDQPDFVFISFNHPNPKLQKLPTVLAATFNTICVGFCETPDLRTESRLTAAIIPYKLVGAASGPSIHRRVKQILGEFYGQGESRERSIESDVNLGHGQSDAITISGGKRTSEVNYVKGGSNAYVPTSNANTQTRSQLAYKPNHNQTSLKTNQNDIFAKLQQALAGGDGDSLDEDQHESLIEEYEEHEKQQEYNNDQDEIVKRDSNDPLDLNQESAKDKSTSSIIINKGTGVEQIQPEVADAEGYKRSLEIQKGENKKTKSDMQISEGEYKKSPMIFEESEKLSQQNKISSEEEDFHRRKKKPVEVSRLSESNSYLKDAVKKAIDELGPSDKPENLDLRNLSKLGVIPIKMGDLSGYLMIASTVEEDFDDAHLSLFKNSFIKTCVEQGKSITIHSEMLIDTIPIDLIKWTEEMGEYTFIREFGLGHMIVSLIVTDYNVPELEEDKQHHKLKVPIDLIVPGTELQFNAYIYMDKNKKFLTIGKDGRSLSEKQLKNLNLNKKNLFIKKEDINLFKKYFATNVINDLIDFYLKNENENEKVG